MKTTNALKRQLKTKTNGFQIKRIVVFIDYREMNSSEKLIFNYYYRSENYFFSLFQSVNQRRDLLFANNRFTVVWNTGV